MILYYMDEIFICDLSVNPHLLFVGQSSTEKNACIKTLTKGLLKENTPEEFQIVNLKETKFLSEELSRRINILNEQRVRSIKEMPNPKFPYIVVIVEDLKTMQKKVGKAEFDEFVKRTAQIGRPAGIHLVIFAKKEAHVTPIIKSNIPMPPSRII
jgi:DNA segregation ATPase FtsK/SpoIIIE-like protein